MVERLPVRVAAVTDAQGRFGRGDDERAPRDGRDDGEGRRCRDGRQEGAGVRSGGGRDDERERAGHQRQDGGGVHGERGERGHPDQATPECAGGAAGWTPA